MVTTVAPFAHRARRGPVPHGVHPCCVNAAISGPRASAREEARQSTYQVRESALTIGAPMYEQLVGSTRPTGVAAGYGVDVAPDTVTVGAALMTGADPLARAELLAGAEPLAGAAPKGVAGADPQLARVSASARQIAAIHG